MITEDLEVRIPEWIKIYKELIEKLGYENDESIGKSDI